MEWVYFVLTYACFLSFWHSSLFVFIKSDHNKTFVRFSIKILSIVIWNILPFMFFFTNYNVLSLNLNIGIALSSLALVIYWFSVRSIKGQKFHVISTTLEQESEIFTGGIYKWIRHPFYTAYFVCYIGVLITFSNLVNIVVIPTIIIIYYLEARKEELRLQQVSENYSDYSKVVGMFWPKIKKGFLKKKAF